MSNIIIKNKSSLALNESQAEGGKKYIYEGVFTPCGVENRNNRIYDPEEVLPHLAYLRDKIKSEGSILGELDHPEGRFEVFVKDASHKITDLWYDPKTKSVMGKLEVLPTPNGKIVQAIADAGCPIFVSSRAAGTVGPDKHVHIQQIFTYDIVAVPGFAEAKLDQVSESMRAQVMSFLNESKETASKNKAYQYGVTEDNIYIAESEFSTGKKANINTSYDIESLSKPINEDIKVKMSPEKAQELGITLNNDNANSGDANQDNGSTEEKHDASEIIGIVPKYAEQKPDFIQDIQPEFKSSVNGTDDAGASNTQQNNTQNIPMSESKGKTAIINLMNETKKEEQPEDNKEVKKNKYDEELDISETDDTTPNPIADGKKGSDTDKIVASSHKKEEKEEKGGNDDNVDQNATSKNDTAEEKSEISESVKDDKNIKRLQNKQKELKESTDSFINEYEARLSEFNRMKSVKESIMQRYPFTVSLSPENFDKFAVLTNDEKDKCNSFIVENQIYDINAINEQFMRPLFTEKLLEKNYLRLADKSDLDLYFAASPTLRESIDHQASLFILENKEDVDEFWRRMGLRDKMKEQVQNESFVENFNEKMADVEQNNGYNVFGYDNSFIEAVGRMM